ncbi:DUF916 and DUF3324 domain-containing protein [Weissella cibaria]|uniref:DUF916 and DUF3324 domain-containing protein n=1 Tax=Weissella cibaria TaxID=137591 RepID=UPI0016813320|nr:DUF916 and DUF3324 domain-containing protein [Weissella cibaria]MBD1501121.1 DUF916 and DUF3324 domain-containing protein [Weissella cibaria]
MKRMKLLMALLVTAFVSLASQTVSADNSMNYVVSPQMPDNQIDKTLGFYNLKANPGASQTLYVTVQNFASKDIKIHIETGSAGTTATGSVDNVMAADKVKELPVKMGDLLSVEHPDITIKAKTSVDVPVKFTMTKQKVTGLIAGGLRFSEVDDTSSVTNNNAIQTKLAYALAVMARQSDDLPKPKLDFGGAKASQVDGQNVVKLTFNNVTSTFVNRLAVTAKVTDNKGKTVKKFAQSMMQMAPNSTMNWAMQLQGKAFKAGTYHVATVAYYSQNTNGKYKAADGTKYNYKQTFKSTFTLSANQAQKLNRTDAVQNAANHLPVWAWIIIVLLVIVFGLVAFIILWFLKMRKPNLAIFVLPAKWWRKMTHKAEK